MRITHMGLLLTQNNFERILVCLIIDHSFCGYGIMFEGCGGGGYLCRAIL